MNQEDWYLVALDTAHIQSYIFNSNRLQENVGASYLVAMATGDWAFEEVHQIFGGACNVYSDSQTEDVWNLDGNRRLEDGQIRAEVIYAGGGNFVALFVQQEDAQAFIGRHSRRVLMEAPGLHVVYNLHPFSWTESLHDAVKDLLKGLKDERSQQAQNMGLGGLGVTAMCSSSSLPAVQVEKEDDGIALYSAEVAAKRAAFEAADKRLKQELGLGADYFYARDFDELGRSIDELSYIAVVHADGNDMGNQVHEVTKGYTHPKDNRKYIEKLRDFSQQIKRASRQALEQTARTLLDSIQENEQGDLGIYSADEQRSVPILVEEYRLRLPFRPLVFGGDDITFVCDGRIGIALALEFVKQFENATEQVLKQRFTACAGISIIKTHYPFARAYDLAEELCQTAKSYRREEKEKYADLSAIDWHFTTTGLYSDLEAMREREYAVKAGYLTLRPVFVETHIQDTRQWQIIERAIGVFQTDWADHRSKAKGLMEALRDNDVQTYKLRYLENVGLALPDVGMETATGWSEQYCLYYDALELMDLYIGLGEHRHA